MEINNENKQVINNKTFDSETSNNIKKSDIEISDNKIENFKPKEVLDDAKTDKKVFF